MAKKRTSVIGYGKVNQRLDAAGTAYLKQGNLTAAAEMFDKSSKKLYERRHQLGLPVPAGAIPVQS